MRLFRDSGVSTVLIYRMYGMPGLQEQNPIEFESLCIRSYTAVLCMVLSGFHEKSTIFRDALE